MEAYHFEVVQLALYPLDVPSLVLHSVEQIRYAIVIRFNLKLPRLLGPVTDDR